MCGSVAAAHEAAVKVVALAPLASLRRNFQPAAIVVVGLAALLLALVVGLNTGPGKRFIAGQLAGYSTQSGINIRVRGIEGSIYSHMILRGLEVRDQKGVFLTSPEVAIDWHPFAYLHSKIDLDSVTAGDVRMLRNPSLKPVPSEPNAPTIPDIDLTLGHLRIDRFLLEHRVSYPSRSEQEAIVEQTTGAVRVRLEPVLDAASVPATLLSKP